MAADQGGFGMAPAPIYPPPEGTDLGSFVDAVRAILYKMAHDLSPILFRGSRRDDIKKAFSEFDDQDPDRWDSLKQKLADRNSQAALTSAGLGANTGQLRAKLKSFWDAFKRFNELGTAGVLKRVLKWMNKILSSILSALKVDEALKELKELLEGEVEDTLEDAGA
jgi:hypothetical protein